MQPSADHCTIDLTRTAGRIARDVRFTPQVYDDRIYYHVHQAVSGTWYRIGYDEYILLSLLDGHTSFCEALARTAQQRGATALPAEQAESLYRWAIEHGIVELAEDDQARDHRPSRDPLGRLQKLNPFWIRIPLGRPQQLLDAAAPFLGWLFSPLATVAAMALIVLAAVVGFHHRKQFQEASEGILAPDNWLYLLLAWMLLKIVHEFAHGLVCRRYGGSVRQTGIVLAFFAPLAFVDVTDCWSFRSRWQRIHTALAGIYVELLIASAAVFFWLQTDSMVLKHLTCNVIVMASLSTLLFNANPLMKFDGYYVLSDLLKIPNLYSRASEILHQTAARIAFGTIPARPPTVGRQYHILLLYGLAAWGWRIFICASMIITASVLFEGAGVLLSVLAVVAWFASPLIRLARHVWQISKVSPPRALRGAAVTLPFGLSIIAALATLPVPLQNTAPAIITLPDGHIVRSAADGFVRKIHVRDGQLVRQGQLLVTLSHPETELRHVDQQLQLQQETIRLQAAQQNHDMQTAAVAKDQLRSLKQQLQETQAQVDGLQVTASADGVVIARNLSDRLNTFVHKGDELMCIDDGRHREVRLSVAQHDYSEITRQPQQHHRVMIGTRQPLQAVLRSAVPRASRQLSLQPLAATYGGPLAVHASDDAPERLQLTEQRFEATLQLQPATAVRSLGERGYVVLDSQHGTLGSWLYYGVREWIAQQLEAALPTGRT